MNERNFFAELKRRNVYKVAVAYAVVGWVIAQIATQIFPFLEIPNWIVRLVIVLIVIGFPIALIIAWAFEATPEGIKRTEVADAAHQHSKSRAWISVVVIGAAISLGLFFLGRYSARSTSGNAPSPMAEKSIAVLPFESLSEDKANAYFADGIQDEILARLSKIADLKVISRTSTQKYKSAPSNLREIAQQLGVTNILEGSVQKAGDQVRITVQLINALSDSHLWADTYDRKMIDIFGVESDVAQRIAGSLEAKLTGREKKEIAFVGTSNPDAYDAYLRGLALRGAQGQEESEQQRTFFERAVQLDPNYAQAWALLGQAEALAYFNDASQAKKESARHAVETALRLAPDLADSRMAQGVFNYYCLHDYDAAIAELSAALERAPNNGSISYFIGLVQRRQGRFDDSLRGMQQAAALDPLNEDILVNLGNTYRGLRKFVEARAMFDRALTIVPQDSNILSVKAETYLAQGDLAATWGIISKLKLSPGDADFAVHMSLLWYGRQVDQMVKELSTILAKKDNPPIIQQITHAAMANLFLVKGDRAAAAPYIEQVRSDRDELRRAGGISAYGSPLYEFDIQMEARLGNRTEVEKEIRELLEETRHDKWEFPNAETIAAVGYLLLSDFDHAYPFLEDAITRPSARSLTPAYLRLDPIWDGARSDPRFQKLVSGKKL
jgi:TolB-like protein/cytochrome c-type biogenesis protein CcmH/NrfG